jgi:hypothetical protein
MVGERERRVRRSSRRQWLFSWPWHGRKHGIPPSGPSVLLSPPPTPNPSLPIASRPAKSRDGQASAFMCVAPKAATVISAENHERTRTATYLSLFGDANTSNKRTMHCKFTWMNNAFAVESVAKPYVVVCIVRQKCDLI